MAMRLFGAVMDRKTSLDGLTDNEHDHLHLSGACPTGSRSDARHSWRCPSGTLARLRPRLAVFSTGIWLLGQNIASSAAFCGGHDSVSCAVIHLAVAPAKENPQIRRLAGLAMPLNQPARFCRRGLEVGAGCRGKTCPCGLWAMSGGRKLLIFAGAPGGKTVQLALAGARVTAVDLSVKRLKRLEQNMAQLGLMVETWAADLRKIAPDQPFDAVLLDAPYSSTGTVRRHPDVLWIKR